MKASKTLRRFVNRQRRRAGKKNGVVSWIFDHPVTERSMAKDRKRLHGPKPKISEFG